MSPSPVASKVKSCAFAVRLLVSSVCRGGGLCLLAERFSLWRKMERRRAEEKLETISLDDLTDVVAMRAVVSLDKLEDESDKEWRDRGIFICYRYARKRFLLATRSQGRTSAPFRISYLLQRHMCEPGYQVRIQDYISAPKPNGYMRFGTPESNCCVNVRLTPCLVLPRSLHTTIKHDGQVMEVQVRTGKTMDYHSQLVSKAAG
jgi:hypothetical protein